MSQERISVPVAGQPEPFEERPFDRRSFLKLAAAPVAAVALSACGDNEGEYYPDGGFPSDPSWLEPSPTPIPPSTEASASPTRSPEKPEKPDVAGRRVEGTSWEAVEYPGLADSIRAKGIEVAGDSRAAGITDPQYLSKAVVIGVPAKDVRGETLHVALVPRDASDPYADRVDFTQIPRKNRRGESQVPGKVAVEANDSVLPYRVAVGEADYTVAFVTGDLKRPDEGEKPDWTTEATYLISPKVSVSNSTFSNAPLIA